MAEEKVYCKRASELRPFSQLPLPQKSKDLLSKYCDERAALAAMRWLHANHSRDGYYFAQSCAEMTFDGSQEEWEKFEDACDECVDDLEKYLSEAGFYNEAVNYRFHSFLNGLLRDSFDFYWSEMEESGEFEKWYESRNGSWNDDKCALVMEMLKKELTPLQFSVIEFERSHPEYYFYVDDDYVKERRDVMGYENAQWFKLTAQEKASLEAAHKNICELLAERVFEIIFS